MSSHWAEIATATHLSDDLHKSMSLVEETSLQARLRGSGLEESAIGAGGGIWTWTFTWGCCPATVTSMLSSESKFTIISAVASWGSSAGDFCSAFSNLALGNSILSGFLSPSMFMSPSLSSVGKLDVLTWEPPLGLLRVRGHLGREASSSISVSLLSNCSVPWAFFNAFLFFSFLTRFPVLSSDGEAGILRIEGAKGDLKDGMSAESLTSQSLMGNRGLRGLFVSAKEVRLFLAVCMALSVVSISVSDFSLESAGSLKFDGYSSGCLSGEAWKLTAKSATSSTNNPKLSVTLFSKISYVTISFYSSNTNNTWWTLPNSMCKNL